MNRADRIRGCLLGGAIGDALGAPIEFMSTSEIRQRFGPAGVVDFEPAFGRPGAMTDDTQMTLFTAEGLMRGLMRSIDRGSCNLPSVLRNAYLRWLLTQGIRYEGYTETGFDSGWLITNEILHSRRAPGSTCLSALQSGEFGTIEDRINDSKGCGAVMRAAPAGFVGRRTEGDTDGAFGLGADAGALTHGHPSGYLAAGTLAEIVAGIADGLSIVDAVDCARLVLRSYQDHEEVDAALGKAVELAESERDSAPETIETLGGGWVGEEALAISVYCCLAFDEFMPAVLAAVNHSGDSDSTGSIAGNIMGAALGASALPPAMLDALEGRELIDKVAVDFSRFFSRPGGTDFTPSNDDWSTYPCY